MDDVRPLPNTRGGLTGGHALAAAAAGLIVAVLWHLPARSRGMDDLLLIHQGVWAAVMAVPAGLAVAALRRGSGRWAAGVALAISLGGVSWVIARTAQVLVR